MTASQKSASSPASASSRPWAATSTTVCGARCSPASRASARSRASTTATTRAHRRRGQGLRPRGLHRQAAGAAPRPVLAVRRRARRRWPQPTRTSTSPPRRSASAPSSAAASAACRRLQSEIEKLIEKGPERVNPLLIPMMIPNMGAAHVSLELGTKGPLSATCTACAAGSNAIGDAFEHHPSRRRRGDVRRRQRGAHQPGGRWPASPPRAPSARATTIRRTPRGRSTPAATAS